MQHSQIHFQWKTPALAARTGVSLHSHTLHSRESLDFIDRAVAGTPWLSDVVRQRKEQYRKRNGIAPDLNRAWWTPPLSALQAWKLEASQIRRSLQMDALVSITDHDTIEGCQRLRLLRDTRHCPLSVEWSVPFRRAIFHLGVHNMPAEEATAMMARMTEVTASGGEGDIAALLDWVTSAPGTLIVLNHPLFDEAHIGVQAHEVCAIAFMEQHRQFIHALELNGLRPWKENRSALQLAAQFGLPVISGGDRHGREANACINLSNATQFDEFISEVRHDGRSEVLFLRAYREPFRLRILENVCEVLEYDPHHSMGWTHWYDRVFYIADDGTTKSASELRDQVPALVSGLISLATMVKDRRLRLALRAALQDRQEFAL